MTHGLEPGKRPPLASLAWQVPMVLVLWLSLLEWPMPPLGSLDASWGEVLIDSWLHGRQFGREFAFTYGPWGFLFARQVLPDAFSVKVVWEVSSKLVLAWLFVALGAELSIWRRLTLLAVVILLTPWSPDALWMIVTTVILVRGCVHQRDGVGLRVAAAAALAFLALTKFTLFLLSAGALAASGVLATLDARWRTPAVSVAAFVIACAVFWLAAGQQLSHVGSFLLMQREIASGYADAMALDEPRSLQLLGISVLAGTGSLLLLGVLKARRSVLLWEATLAVGLATLLAWKAGFTRADPGHTAIFFVFALLVVTSLPSLLGTRVSAVATATVLLLAIAGLVVAIPLVPVIAVPAAMERIPASARTLFDVPKFRAGYMAGVEAERSRSQLSGVRREVGTAPIDFVGNAQGLLYLNDLHHRTRPIPQSYAAYTPALLNANLEFMLSPSAPAYVLAAMHPIDNTYGGQSDASALAGIARAYEPVCQEHGYALLARKTGTVRSPLEATREVLDLTALPGEELQLPDVRTHAIWMRVEAIPAPFNWVRDLLWKPRQLALTVVDDRGQATGYRLLPGVATSGFVIQPRLSGQEDLEAFLSGGAARWVRAVRVDRLSGDRDDWRGFRVRLWQLIDLPLGPTRPLTPCM